MPWYEALLPSDKIRSELRSWGSDNEWEIETDEIMGVESTVVWVNDLDILSS